MKTERTTSNKYLMSLYLWLTVIIPAGAVGIALIPGDLLLSKNGAGILAGILLIAVYFGVLYIPTIFPTDSKKARYMVGVFLCNIFITIAFASFNLYSLYVIFLIYGLTNIITLFLYVTFLGIAGIAKDVRAKKYKQTPTGLILAIVSFLFMLLPASSLARLTLHEVSTPQLRDYLFLVYVFVGIVYTTFEMSKKLNKK